MPMPKSKHRRKPGGKAVKNPGRGAFVPASMTPEYAAAVTVAEIATRLAMPDELVDEFDALSSLENRTRDQKMRLRELHTQHEPTDAQLDQAVREVADGIQRLQELGLVDRYGRPRVPK